ncbi:MAG: DUF2236 domain-containing protein, partial [Chloroflexi bacterium]|nr:DUF2236 domain-containing protein [Chloroflexota bacterium]
MASPEALLEVSPLGPETISWRINQEIMVLAGWSAAVLLQLAHPLVLQGVLDHSVFVADPGRRLERAAATVRSFLHLAFGSEKQIRDAAATINGIHDRVHGHLPRAAGAIPAGAVYDAHDPELLRWVHATLVDVLPRTYELFIAPLSAAEKERYYQEAATVGPLLGIPAGFLPDSAMRLERYLDRMYGSGNIAVTDGARRLSRDILRPPLPLPAWLARLAEALLAPAYWLNSLPGIGLLPEHIRQAYGFRWRSVDSATLRAGSMIVRRLLPLLPRRLRWWPAARP